MRNLELIRIQQKNDKQKKKKCKDIFTLYHYFVYQTAFSPGFLKIYKIKFVVQFFK